MRRASVPPVRTLARLERFTEYGGFVTWDRQSGRLWWGTAEESRGPTIYRRAWQQFNGAHSDRIDVFEQGPALVVYRILAEEG